MNNIHIFFYWIIASFVLLLFEIGHPGLFFFSAFSAGALSAAFASLWYSWIVQCCVFLFATLCALALLRYWVAHYLHKGQEHYHSNVYALVGKRAVVVMAITPDSPGKVKVDGELWVARLTHTDEPIGVGSLVEIVGSSGSHLKVKSVN